MTIKIEGIERVMEQLKQKGAEVEKKTRDAVHRSAYRIHGSAVKRIQNGPASGRTYEKYQPRRTHKASAKGEAPMADTGELVSKSGVNTDSMYAEVVFFADYARYLEFGTTKMDPRPFLVPSLEEDIPVLRSELMEVAK